MVTKNANPGSSGSPQDTVTGGTAQDTVTGGTAEDTVTGGTAEDTVTGGTAEDTVTGSTTGDAVSSGANGAVPATDFAPSGAPIQIVADVDPAHPAVDNDPRANTTVDQNRIDFNDPTISGAEAVKRNLEVQAKD